MSRAKVFISILMVLILTVLSGASVWAAPRQDVITGIVDNIKIVTEVDPNTGETITTVLVTLVDESGETQTVRLSLETAASLGLVQVDKDGKPVLDDDGNPIVNKDWIDQPVEIDPNLVLEIIEEEGEQAVHPVASALAKFIRDKLGLDDDLYETIMGYHEEDGHGFGIIAQAWWMSVALTGEGDAKLLGDILDAKKGHNGFEITLPGNGTTMTTTITAKNWGQFRQAVLRSEKVKKNLANLGAIMSGRAAREQEQEEEEEVFGLSTELPGKGKDKGGKPDTPPGKEKDKDEGDGPPAEPPGKVKNKDKGKGGGKKE